MLVAPSARCFRCINSHILCFAFPSYPEIYPSSLFCSRYITSSLARAVTSPNRFRVCAGVEDALLSPSQGEEGARLASAGGTPINSGLKVLLPPSSEEWQDVNLLVVQDVVEPIARKAQATAREMCVLRLLSAGYRRFRSAFVPRALMCLDLCIHVS